MLTRPDDSLESLLAEAFSCLEHCFQHLDGNKIGMIIYPNFENHDALNLAWRHVDLKSIRQPRLFRVFVFDVSFG
jgi:hypothetical protein